MRQLIYSHKEQRKNISAFLVWIETVGNKLLAHIVVGDETSKQKTQVHLKLMAWHLVNSTRKKKYKAVSSLGEVHGFIRAAIMPKRTTISADSYVEKLTKLCARCR
jgi:hypothetical protein